MIFIALIDPVLQSPLTFVFVLGVWDVGFVLKPCDVCFASSFCGFRVIRVVTYFILALFLFLGRYAAEMHLRQAFLGWLVRFATYYSPFFLNRQKQFVYESGVALHALHVHFSIIAARLLSVCHYLFVLSGHPSPCGSSRIRSETPAVPRWRFDFRGAVGPFSKTDARVQPAGIGSCC